MLQAADAALAGVKLSDEARPRTGVFIGLNLDLNTTNYHFRWWVLKHARSGRRWTAASPEDMAWQRSLLDDRAGPQRQPRHGGAGQHRRQPHRAGVPPRRPEFHSFQRGNVAIACRGRRGASAAARRT